MSQSQQHSLWSVSQGEAISMSIGPGPRELSVSEGRLWLTLRGALDAPAEDHWLEAGESVQLPSGSRVVMEAWPQAAFHLLVPPCPEVVRQQAGRAASQSFWRRFWTASSSRPLSAA